VPPENFPNERRGDLISPCSPAEKLLLQSLSFNFKIFKLAYSLQAVAFLLKNRQNRYLWPKNHMGGFLISSSTPLKTGKKAGENICRFSHPESGGSICTTEEMS
jgi:hypothetical protein